MVRFSSGVTVWSAFQELPQKMPHQGSPKQIVQNVIVGFQPKFPSNIPQSRSPRKLQLLFNAVVFFSTLCVLHNIFHTLHISLLKNSISCKAEWKFYDVKIIYLNHIFILFPSLLDIFLNYYRDLLSNCCEITITDETKDNFEYSFSQD